MNSEWIALVEKSLKANQTFNDLVFTSQEEIKVFPFYDQSNSNNIQIKPPKDWQIVADFFPNNDWQIDCLNLDSLPIGENQPSVYSKYFTRNLKLAKERYNHNKDFVFLFSPLTELAENGCWNGSKEQEIQTWFDVIKEFNSLKSICIDVSLFQNAGLNIVHQIAISLLLAKEYMELFGEKIIPQFILQTSVGGDFYFELAKIKSTRFLFEKLFSDYGFGDTLEIIARDSKRNKSVLSQENNTIRSTIGCVSAIFGGADYIWPIPYNFLSNPKDFSTRELAYKQLLILREESHLNKFYNPTEGAYFINHLQKEMIEKSWKIFLDWESKGGYLKLLQQDFFAKIIEEDHLKEQKLFDEKKLSLVGVNQFANFNKTPNTQTQTKLYNKTEFTPIVPKRLSEPIENANQSNL